MKTINSITKLVAIIFTFVIYSCSQDEAPTPTPTPPAPTPTLAVVTTDEVTTFTKTTATFSGKITADGGAAVTARGIVYGTSPAPTVANTNVAAGTGNGNFSANITGLSLKTTYYVRAYATNSVGTTYGNEVVLKTGDIDIYLAGGTGNDAGYWKNATYTALTSNDTKGAFASAIYVSGKDVYVTGYYLGSALVYWKNGVPTKLTDGTNGNVGAADIFVSGTDVYVGGYEIVAGKEIPKLWKNGTEMTLQFGAGGANISSVFVSGSDVYASGAEKKNGLYVAKYWKNGVGIDLSDGTNSAYALTIFVRGNDVFVGGYQSESGNRLAATYWKNGTEMKLTNGPDSYFVNDMFVDDSGGVYSVGTSFNSTYTLGNALLWKNSVETSITGNTSAAVGSGKKVWVSGGDVYVFGENADASGYNRYIWKNGVKLTPYDGTFSVNNYTVDMFIEDK